MRAPIVVLVVCVGILGGCGRQTVRDDPGRIEALQHTYNQLHARLEKATESDPVVASAFAAQGQVIMGMRASLMEQLAGEVALQYLDNVTVDLKDVTGKSSGKLGKDTFLGHIKLGEWKVNVRLGNLTGKLRVGTPKLSLRGRDLIDVKLPVHVEETEGDARLLFSWDSASITNVLCKDFEVDRRIRGRVLPQRHVVSGAMRLNNTGEDLIAAPVFPNRHIQLKVDLTPSSWATVEEALRSQNHSGKCGTLLKPDNAMGFLRQLAENGIRIRLPDKIFRTVRLPAHVHESVQIDQRTVRIGIKAEAFRLDGATLWSSASISVLPPPVP